MVLNEPYEILEVQDGQSLSFHVLKWDQGDVTIKPAHAPEGKVVQVLRLHVPQAEKAHFPFYWDATSKTLAAQLVPLLPGIVEGKRLLTITKHGIAPKARFTLEVQ